MEEEYKLLTLSDMGGVIITKLFRNFIWELFNALKLEKNLGLFLTMYVLAFGEKKEIFLRG